MKKNMWSTTLLQVVSLEVDYLYLLANKMLLLMLPLDLSISLTLCAQSLEQCLSYATSLWGHKTKEEPFFIASY